jgi:rRNA biogenesis protein RRP5
MLGADEDDEPTASASTLTEARASSSASALELSGGFSWSAKDTDDQIDEDSDSDNDELRVASEQSKKKKKGIQQDLTADLQTKAPESSSDFERLLIGSPDSSFLWIQYMSFQLQISELDKARDIGRRALKTISYREEGEKLNVWVALLNLENAFGTEETADKMFKEAVQFNDPQVVHLKFAGILEQSEKFEVRDSFC